MQDIIMQRIRERQRQAMGPDAAQAPEHKPPVLYIGCSDARINVHDIGFEDGEALIFRNIAALVLPTAYQQSSAAEAQAMRESGTIPESVSLGAVLEFFINELPSPQVGVKHIVISGHTQCGGIRACYQGVSGRNPHLSHYLSALEAIKEKVVQAMPGAAEEEKLRALEEESVRQSVRNAMSYDVVREAVESGKVQLHGWVLNTATKRIMEMGSNGKFHAL